MMSLTLSNIQLQETLQRIRGNIRPWGEFISAKSFQLPANGPTAGKRVLTNFDRFYGNYSVIFLTFLVAAIFASPILLLAIGVCIAICCYIKIRYKDANIKILGRELSPMQQYAGVMLLSVPLLWLLGAGAAFSWVFGLSILVSVLHSLVYNSDESLKSPEMNIEHV